MSLEQTPHLALPLVAAAQAQKHVTVNEALVRLDAVAQLGVKSRSLASPPAMPAAGDRYIVPAAAGGAWAGQAMRIAHWHDGHWDILQPKPGWGAFVVDEGVVLVWNGLEWSGALPASLPRLGVGTSPTATDRLAVASAASLFSHAGAGHQLKVNKADSPDTASVVFQRGFSARGEIGLAGDDDMRIKVSPDGQSFVDALRIERATGIVHMPATPGRRLLQAATTYHVSPSGSDAADGRTAQTAFATLQRAYTVIARTLDLGGQEVTIQLADGVHSQGLAITSGWTGGGGITIRGNSANPSAVTLSSVEACISISAVCPGAVTLSHLRLLSSSDSAVLHNGCGLVRFANVVFGACASFHLYTGGTGAVITATGNYTIGGGAAIHMAATRLGQINVAGRTVTLTGAPAFSLWFAYATRGGVIAADASTFSGAATGTRFLADMNGVLFTNGGGASYLPGSAGGSVNSGGVYA